MILGWFFIDISGFVSSFGPASCLPQGIIILHPWNAAGPPGKLMCQRFSCDKGSCMHAIMMDVMILGTFDEAPGTLQSPGVRADAQCCKSLREWGRHGASFPPGLATLRVGFRGQSNTYVHHLHARILLQKQSFSF